METLNFPNEKDFKLWIKEALKQYFEADRAAQKKAPSDDEPFISRKEAALLLCISLVTLTDWMKKGLPFHKPRGRVYFLRSEILDHIKTNRMGQYKPSKQFSETGKVK